MGGGGRGEPGSAVMQWCALAWQTNAGGAAAWCAVPRVRVLGLLTSARFACRPCSMQEAQTRVVILRTGIVLAKEASRAGLGTCYQWQLSSRCCCTYAGDVALQPLSCVPAPCSPVLLCRAAHWVAWSQCSRSLRAGRWAAGGSGAAGSTGERAGPLSSSVVVGGSMAFAWGAAGCDAWLRLARALCGQALQPWRDVKVHPHLPHTPAATMWWA